MYMPPQFTAKDAAIAADLIRENPFASLISVDGEGLPFVTHLPIHLEARTDAEAGFVLLGHCAKPNPHAKLLAPGAKAVVTFLGPHAYQSPKVYEDKQKVPTWNYVAVHCTVEVQLLEGPEAKDALLKKLIGDHEPAYAEQWRSLPEDFAHKMLAGIVAFELKVLQLQCKLKLNQHRPESHAALYAGYAAGSDNERGLAGWMDRLGLRGT
jgi:transcriptional regulator